jgi:hypothetical protein
MNLVFKRITVACLSIILLLSIASAAFSYALSPYRIFTIGGGITFKYGAIATAAKDAFNQATYDWCSAVTGVNFYSSSSSSNQLYSLYSTGIAERGEVIWRNEIGYTGKFTNFDSYINTAYSAGTNNYRSTANHEFGHVLGLDHVSGTAIMNGNRDRETIYIPQTDDKNGAKNIWGL